MAGRYIIRVSDNKLGFLTSTKTSGFRGGVWKFPNSDTAYVFIPDKNILDTPSGNDKRHLYHHAYKEFAEDRPPYPVDRYDANVVQEVPLKDVVSVVQKEIDPDSAALPALIEFLGLNKDTPETDTSCVFERIGKSRVCFPPSSQKRYRKMMEVVLNEVGEALDNHGLGDLLDVIIILSKSSSNHLARYLMGNGTMIMTRKGLSADGVLTMIHELGHRWEDVGNFGDEIRGKYEHAIRQASANGGVEIVPDIDIGETVIVPKGATSSIKEDTKAVFLYMDGHIITIKLADKPATIRLDVGHQAAGVPYSAELRKENGEPVRFRIVKSDEWFPTKYSMTNHHEMFAELFVLYVKGKLEGEVLEWFDSLPRP